MKFEIKMRAYRRTISNRPITLSTEVYEIPMPRSSLENRERCAEELVEKLTHLIGNEALLYKEALMIQLLMHDESLIVIQDGKERGVYPMDYSFETYRESYEPMASHMPRRPWVSDFRGYIFPKELLSNMRLSLDLHSIRTAKKED